MRPPRIALLVLLLSTLAAAQFRPGELRRGNNEATNLVRQYCRLDLDGARLRADSWARMKPLTSWKFNPDWQAFTVVSQYEIVSTNEGLRSTTVRVRYGVLGHFHIGVGYTPDAGPELVDFMVRRGEEGWKIEQQEPMINPHVSKARAVQWLETAAASERDAGNKAALESAVKALQGK